MATSTLLDTGRPAALRTRQEVGFLPNFNTEPAALLVNPEATPAGLLACARVRLEALHTHLFQWSLLDAESANEVRITDVASALEPLAEEAAQILDALSDTLSRRV